MREQALDEFGLAGTPTFYVNGKTLTGDKTLEQLAAEIDPLIPADFAPVAPAAEVPATDAMAPATDAMAPAAQ
ncbi:thioredoxin domain-containing protein [Devosia ginsengisoli]|uniref:thioredoxin domain-containing protein n=1 Tax=Devosia ginsengisoli TaxID=400770 RepID=UPI0026EEF7C3|nr:thioredoxin domain-containing protein [Devosia ginsengisoli]MCR6673539.1 DsbA family protein [Devosia ginsengisoli]